MAEINIERKRERSPWPLIVAIVAIIAVAAAVWYYTRVDRVGTVTAPTDATPTPVDTARTPPGDDAAAAFDVSAVG